MQIISTREFRANQGKFLNAAMQGQSVILNSRYGNFKIVPVSEEDTITSRICKGLKEVKLIKEGKLKDYTLEEALDEL